MKKILCLLALLSSYAEAAIISSGVKVNLGNTVTVNFISTGSTASSGDLTASGMRYFGVGVMVTGKTNGDPSPFPPGYGTLFGIGNGGIALAPGDTWATAAQKFVATYSASGSFTSTNPLSNTYTYEACVFASTSDHGGTSSTLIYPGSCSTIPWTTVSCSISNTTLLIDHGTLNSSEVNGHSASQNTSVTCNGSATVRFRVSESRTYLGNGIFSDIYVNGRGFDGSWGQMNYSVPSYGLPLTIESKLVSPNPQPGVFSGSVVVIMDLL